MTHIVFQEADVNTLKEAIKLDASLTGDVLQIKDEFAVGPLTDIYSSEGYEARRTWWKMLLEFSPYTISLEKVDDKTTAENLIKALNEDVSSEVWIWMAPNQHDVCGYYWLISQLKEFRGRVLILYLHNLPFINDKGGIFYPSDLFQIQPKEFLKAKKLARPVTSGEFEADNDEWRKLCSENTMVRILEGGKKITGKDVDYYDKDILSAVTAEPQKLQKVLHTLYAKLKLRAGDVFAVWRIREMINEGKLYAEGDWNKGWKDIFVKSTATPVITEVAETTT